MIKFSKEFRALYFDHSKIVSEFGFRASNLLIICRGLHGLNQRLQ
jgi:hypothetical protein